MDSTELAKRFQQNEITESVIYASFAKRSSAKNRPILSQRAQDEKRHYEMWKSVTGIEVAPRRGRVLLYVALSFIFGVTFAMKLMESGEKATEETYKSLSAEYPEVYQIYADEEQHEKLLYQMIEEEKLSYLGSIVLGLNDALVEITGTLAGLSFAFEGARTAGVAGLITGVAASLSMSASEYLSQVAEKGENPVRAAAYTFVAYFGVVLALVFPYFLFSKALSAFSTTLGVGLCVILYYAAFASVIHDRRFLRTFLEMLAIVIGVSVVSFGIGSLARRFFGITI
ncbi:rubrerythrin family protein [Coprothermobacteraceae bacterium]|nr:rubrerythrin family protein [Coprothermobacteraceae bacterium]